MLEMLLRGLNPSSSTQSCSRSAVGRCFLRERGQRTQPKKDIVDPVPSLFIMHTRLLLPPYIEQCTSAKYICEFLHACEDGGDAVLFCVHASTESQSTKDVRTRSCSSRRRLQGTPINAWHSNKGPNLFSLCEGASKHLFSLFFCVLCF